MFSLRKLFGKDDRFFDLLEAGAEEARASVEVFQKALAALASGNTPVLDEMAHARRKEKRIRHEMTEALSRTFVTPLDREDIEALSFGLYRIPKQMEKILERISICPGQLPLAGFQRQGALLKQAVDAVVFMVKSLRTGVKLPEIREANDRLQFAEGEADKVMLTLLRDLYHGSADAKTLIIQSELFEMVEQAVDRCRNAGNIVLQVALKNS